MRPAVRFVLSIDTEEDNWIPARHGITTTNVRQLPAFDDRLQRLGIRATYFVSYQVAASPEAAGHVRAVYARGGSEVGAHLHPWNTPPDSGLEDHVTMLMNYPPELQEEKLRVLMDAIESNVGARPTTFRAGRFGFGASTVPALARNGLYVDSSVTPLLTWEAYDDGPNFVDAPLGAYRFDADDPYRRGDADAPMLEIPISVGATRFSPSLWPRLARLRQSRVAQALHLNGIASRLHLLRWVIMSPETNSAVEMVNASRRLVAGGVDHLHMFVHSNSLEPGMGPFARDQIEVDALLDRIDEYVDSISRYVDLTFCTVSEVASQSTAIA